MSYAITPTASRALPPLPKAAADRTGRPAAELQQFVTVESLAFSIADESARADIETMCPYQYDASGRPWFDTTLVTDVDDRPYVEAALQYLILRDLIQLSPQSPNLVGFAEIQS
ncbi:hypothetical protein [Lysobacter sp. CA199]|uniref:hypothetical protein n=1 Tax=Lysobacter sp. CA199 TaxID=3455608 RepID=UPI003F8CFC80